MKIYASQTGDSAISVKKELWPLDLAKDSRKYNQAGYLEKYS